MALIIFLSDKPQGIRENHVQANPVVRREPQQRVNQADDAEYASHMLKYAQKMLDWRMRHADRTLTGYAATPEGLKVWA